MATTKATEQVASGVPAIYSAIEAVQAGIANIPKNGEMKFGQTSYKYLKADDVQDKLNPLLTENHIVVSAQYDVRDVEKGNRQWVYVDLSLTYISSVDGSQFPVVRATGESVAGDDKSVNKALTQAIKNAHRATFQFASGEPEPDDLSGSSNATASAPPKKTPAQAKVDNARKPAESNTKNPKDEIRVEYIETGKVSKEQVNTALQAHNADGKTNAEAFVLILKDLKDGKDL